MNLNGKNILVTGAGGFIGSHAAERMVLEGANVSVLDNFEGGFKNNIPKGINFIDGDIRDIKVCNNATKNIDMVIHCAAHASEGQSVYCPIFNAERNIMGSLNLLVAAINNNVDRFAFTSSIASYGKPMHLPIKETHPQIPEDPYGITKATFEHYLRVYYEIGAIKPVIFRFFNVYGPRQRMDDPYRGVIPIFINKCMKGEQPVIFGDGMQARAFTYIDDIIEPMVRALKSEATINKPLNVGAEDPVTIKKLAEMIIEKMGVDLSPKFVEARQTDVVETFSDVSVAKKLLNWKAKVSMDEGLQRTIEWAKKEGKKEFTYMPNCEIERLAHKVYKQKVI